MVCTPEKAVRHNTVPSGIVLVPVPISPLSIGAIKTGSPDWLLVSHAVGIKPLNMAVDVGVAVGVGVGVTCS